MAAGNGCVSFNFTAPPTEGESAQETRERAACAQPDEFFSNDECVRNKRVFCWL